MKRWSNLLRLAITLLAIILMAACVPAGGPTPTPEDIEGKVATSVAMTIEAQGQVATSVAMTVAVQNTQTAAAIPPPTNTPAATFEPAIITTDTPLVSDTPSPNLPPPATDESTPIATATAEKYTCDAFTQAPKNKAEIKAGASFTIKWIIVNTGTRPWNAGVDVKYSGGTQMTTATRVEIPNALQPGERYTLVLDAVAPKEQGLQYMTWTVQGPLCNAYIAIDVK